MVITTAQFIQQSLNPGSAQIKILLAEFGRLARKFGKCPNRKKDLIPASIYLSKLTIKTLKRHQWRRSGVFIVSFGHISNLVLVFLLLTLNNFVHLCCKKIISNEWIKEWMSAGWMNEWMDKWMEWMILGRTSFSFNFSFLFLAIIATDTAFVDYKYFQALLISSRLASLFVFFKSRLQLFMST